MPPLPSILGTYASCLAVLVALDFVWLGFVARDLYRRQLAALLTDQMNWVAIIALYLILVGGLVFFAIFPGVGSGSLVQAIGLGALLGLVAYSTYDLTNLATLKHWPVMVTIVDIAWGTVLCAVVSGVGFSVARLLG